jgi:hypothetical protein
MSGNLTGQTNPGTDPQTIRGEWVFGGEGLLAFYRFQLAELESMARR